ncbi:kinetochore-associated protein 1 [Phlebotomus argentipes]|uniref:kinetochore-associated protein 1 n=1 Tax=Phlebotomus argentipes TaxID=94469 RepID=UPI002892B72B|nr:kinetochore-associated protein 1 [Phlebotomus argentipes]
MWTEFRQSSNEEVTIKDNLCSNGLFQIASSCVVRTEPKVHAAVQNGNIVVAVDQSVVLIENEECKFLNIPETQIDCVFTSESGKLVVCCMSNGNISGFSIKGYPLFNLKIDENDIGSEKTFVGIARSFQDIYVMCTSGRMYKISNADEERSMTTIESNDTLEFNETIPSNAQLFKLSTQKFYNPIICFAVIPQMQPLTAVFSDYARIYIYSGGEIQPIWHPDDANEIRKLLLVGNYLLGLAKNGNIVEICPFTGMLYTMSVPGDPSIEDMTLLENSEEKTELIILTKPSTIGVKALKVMDFPSMQIMYELDANNHIWLVDQPKCSTGMYYLVGNIQLDLELDDEIPQEIEMKIITETLPQHQLDKMLSHGRLDDAEKFALQFKLSLLPIHKSRISRQVTILSECRNTEVLRQLFVDFLQLLDKIDDNAVFLDYWDIEIPNRQITAEYLKYLQRKITGEDDTEVTIKLKIAEHLRRLETLQLMDPSEWILEWRNFINSQNLLQICKDFLSTNISSACLIWSRHSAYLIPNLDSGNLMKILDTFPSSTEPLSVIQWLNHFTPSLLQIHPEFMPIIVEWSIKRIKIFESNPAWRNNSLEICNSILDIFLNLHFVIIDRRRQHDSSIRSLQVIKFALEDLHVLKSNYNITINLTQYLGNNLEETTFKLLLGVQTENIQSLINDFIYPKFMEKSLSPIASLVQYVNYLVTYNKSFYYWQERAVTVIELIADEDERLQCAQNVLKNAPVPWSIVLQPLTKYSILKHPLAHEISLIYKQQKVTMIKLKYHWPQNAPDNYFMLVSRILKEKTPDLWNDVKSLIDTVPHIRKMAYHCCVHEFTKQGNHEMVLHILSELQEDHDETNDYLMEIFMRMLEDGVDESAERNFMKTLNILNNKSKNSHNSQVQQINRLYKLKMHFGGKAFTRLAVDNLAEGKEMLAKGLVMIVNNLRNYGKDLIMRMWNDVKVLTEALELDFLEGIINLLQMCSHLQLSCAIAYNILTMMEINTDNCDKILQLCALLIIQQSQAFESEETSLEDPLTFAIIHRFLVRVLQVTKLYYIEAKEMVVWMRIVNEFYTDSTLDEYYRERCDELSEEIAEVLIRDHKTTKEKKSEKKRISMSIFDQVSAPSVDVTKEVKVELQTIIKCISTIMQIVVHHPEGTNFGYRLRKIIKSEEELSLENGDFATESLQADLSEYIQKLFKLKMYSALYSITLLVIDLQKKCGIMLIPEESVNIFHKKLMKSSLIERDFNLIECLAQLVSTKSPEKFLRSLSVDNKNDAYKVNYFSLLENYFNLCGDLSGAMGYRESRIKFQFMMEIRKKKPDFEMTFSVEKCTLAQLITEVCTVPIDVTLLQKLFRDFSWKGDYDELMVSQLLTVLNRQELKFSITTDDFGKEVVNVQNSVEDILKQCRPYMTEISKLKLLITRLKAFMQSMNFYFYELYLSIIAILDEINAMTPEMSVWKDILEFLKHKMTVKRRNRSMQKETDEWLNGQCEGGVLPKIANYRFPFQVIIKNGLHETLGEEIYVENCEEWFPLIKIHTAYFSKDMSLMEIIEKFCMTAIKNTIFEYKALMEKSENDGWQLKSSDNSPLKSIIKLTRFMSTEWKIFTVLYFITNYSVSGVDQVEAVQECYRYAVENERAIMVNERVLDQMVKIKRRYPMIKIQHLLHVHKLNEEHLLALVENPTKLIHALYMHESLLMAQPPNITYVVEEIAALNELNLRMLQESLLTKWLAISVDCNETCLDDTLLQENLQESILKEEKGANEDSDMEDYVKRAQYILSSWPIDDTVKFLSTIAYQNDQNAESQLKIFEWFVQLFDNEDTDSVIMQKNYVQMKVISDLKKVGLNLPPTKYHQYEKIALLKKIWQKCHSNPTAIHAMALICLEHNINEPKIWDAVLQKMTHFGMKKELLSIVNFLSVKQELLDVDGLRAAWELLIKSPFEKITGDNEELCRALCLLQTCPVTAKINLVNLAHLCEHIDQVHMAAICMVYANKEDKEIIKRLVMKHKSQKMQNELEQLELHGILPILIKTAISEIFSILD